MQSVLDELATEGVPRLRVGIGSAPLGGLAGARALAVPPEEREVVDRAVARAAEAVESFLDGEDLERIAAATNRASPGAPIPGTEDASRSRREPRGAFWP